ncbi:hypothetical protein B0H67DRAFT_669789 [Lasiosphaeris hirsuta]|uniref:Uncharacterized protein n=1 Tax=Lasiosphaeris hirsuta TaxID=260670 RepID=A0AA40DQ58_9PEZI|nr:hypothetical protein B0H67DRAFT_669789 [Lasiosphaeris hirsuta]
MVAILGIVLQFGAIVYCGLATRYLQLPKDRNPVADHAFPCTVSGTLLLVIGMLLCAHVVESGTTESIWREARVVWLQRLGTVNDQAFKPFAIFPQDAQALITVAGVSVSILGFVVQFTGLCGMHW